MSAHNSRDKSDQLWRDDQQRQGWVMPSASKWKRLPVIRWLRFVCHSIRYARHAARCRSMGMLSSGYDEWVLYGIARGWERSPK